MSALSSTTPLTQPLFAGAARVGRKLVHAKLAQLERGCIVLNDPWGSTSFGGEASVANSSTATPADRRPRDLLRAEVTIHDADFYRRLLIHGGLGVADAYSEGLWDTSDLTQLLRIIVRNSKLNQGIDGGFARLMEPLQRSLHWLRRNTRRGSQRNISEHYDLSNEFFALFLDPTLSYSATIFATPTEVGVEIPKEESLEEAARRKLDITCRKLDLQPSDHLLEIGTGWGGLAIHAAQNYGCKVTTTTISQKQFDLACHRVREAGVADQVEVLLKDYRDLEGSYDKLVSIEMIEAIGAEYFARFFKKCSSLLTEEGLMLLQSITISDRHYQRARREVDFIKKYIFPGCCIPSVGALTRAISKSSDFDWVDADDIGAHYATTLRYWHENFQQNRDAVLELGFDARFLRMWSYYLCYCESGFAERQLRDFQILLAKPMNRRQPLHWDRPDSVSTRAINPPDRGSR